MKRSILLLLLLVLGLAMVVYGNSVDVYSFVYHCSDSTSDYYRFSSSQIDGVWTFVPQDGEGQVFYLDGAHHETVLSFPTPSRGVLLYSGFSQLEIVYADYLPCNETESVQSQGERLIRQALFSIPHDRGQ